MLSEKESSLQKAREGGEDSQYTTLLRWFLMNNYGVTLSSGCRSGCDAITDIVIADMAAAQSSPQGSDRGGLKRAVMTISVMAISVIEAGGLCAALSHPSAMASPHGHHQYARGPLSLRAGGRQGSAASPNSYISEDWCDHQ